MMVLVGGDDDDDGDHAPSSSWHVGVPFPYPSPLPTPRIPLTPRRSSVGGFNIDEEGAPGPGAYDVRSDFKPPEAVYKDPAVGASSAFRSKTTRLFHEEGQVAIKESETPGAGTYTPRTQGSISVMAEAAKKTGARLAGLRRSASAPRTRTVEVTGEGPGPGTYDPLAQIHNEGKKAARRRSAAFVSGARRALPWGGDYNNAPQSTRARNSEKIEDPADTPGPGEYGVPMYPSAVIGGKAAHKKRGANFGSTSAPRFQRDPHPDKVTPGPVHYTPR